MVKQKTFEDLQHDFLLSGGYTKFYHFERQSQGSMRELFAYLWSLPEAHLSLTPETITSSKSKVDAENLQAQGNESFKKGDLKKALEYFTLSIMTAPHPPAPLHSVTESPGDTKSLTLSNRQQRQASNIIEVHQTSKSCNSCLHREEGAFETLALGFINRSAVLFELGQYERCLHDVEMALRLDCSVRWHCRLAERKARCLIALGKTGVTEVLLKTTLEEQNKEDITRLLQLLQEANLKTNGDTILNGTSHEDSSCLNHASARTNNQFQFSYQKFEIPQIVDQNPSIPSLSSAVTVAFTPSQGRHLVATRDIHPGEPLLVESSYAHIITGDAGVRASCCSGCLAPCLAPCWPCPACSQAIFCSDSCLRQGLGGQHGQECTVLPTLNALGLPDNVLLAFKALTTASLSQVQRVVTLEYERTHQIPEEKRGLNEDGLYDTLDYLTVYNLVTNEEQLPVFGKHYACMAAFTVTKLMVACPGSFFSDYRGASEVVTPHQEDLVLLGSLLSHHIMSCLCNSVSIANFKFSSTDYRQPRIQEIGAGVFPVTSLANHSCHPSAVAVFGGASIVLWAGRNIEVGNQVTLSYGPIFYDTVTTPSERRRNLHEHYRFSCRCEACDGDWGTRENPLPDEIMLKCPKCCEVENVDEVTKEIEASPPAPCSHQEWRTLLSELRSVVQNINKHSKDSSKPYPKEYFEAVCCGLEIFEKHVQLPCKEYVKLIHGLQLYLKQHSSHVLE